MAETQQTNPGRMTVEQQRAAGLRPQQTNVVRAYATDQPLPSVQGSGDVLGRLMDAINVSPRTPNRGSQSSDTAITLAQGWIISAIPYLAVIMTVTGAGLLLIWLMAGGEWENYLLAWFLLWGLAGLIVMLLAHRTHLAHSPAGVELADIGRAREDSTNRTTVALRAIDAQHAVIDKQLNFSQERWLLEHGYTPTDRQLTDGGGQ